MVTRFSSPFQKRPRPGPRRPSARWAELVLWFFVFPALAAPALALPISCDDTLWFRRGVSDKLTIDWNTPLPSTPAGDEGLPDAGPEAGAPPTVAISDPRIDDEFSDFIELTIGDLEPGQRVVLERYKVTDPEAGVGPGSPLIGHYVLQDGYCPEFGQVPALSLPGDSSEVEGEILVQFDFYEADAGSIVGDYVFRVRSPTAAFPPVDTPFRVTAVESPQGFTGVVRGGGAPLPHASVAVVDPLQLDKDFINGTTADGSGSYTLYTGCDEFELIAFAPGYVSTFGPAATQVTEEGVLGTVDIDLVPADRTVSGQLVSAAPDGPPLAGVELLFVEVDPEGELGLGRLFAIAWTDDEGRFSAGVTAGRWAVLPRAQGVYTYGFQTAGRTVTTVLDASVGDSLDNTVRMTPGTSLIYGTLTSSETDEAGEAIPLCGVEIRALRYGDSAAAYGVTDGDGDYWLVVAEGNWNVFAYPYSLEDSDHAGPFPSDIPIGEGRTSVEYSFTARPVAAIVCGTVTGPGEEPVGQLELRAIHRAAGSRELCFESTYNSDGYYQIALGSGRWDFVPEPSEAARRGLLFEDLPSLEIEPLDGGDPAAEIEVDIRVVEPAAAIRVAISDPLGTPVGGIRIHASAEVGGSTYHAFGSSGAEGVATLPVIDGDWSVHLSETNLREAGYLELDTFAVTVAGGDEERAVEIRPKANTPAEITLQADLPGGALRLLGSAEPGQRYAVEGSTDLGTWREFGRVIAEGGRFTVTGPDLEGEDRQFLRVRNAE